MKTIEERRKYNNTYMAEYRKKETYKLFQKKYQKWWKNHHKELLSRYSNEFRKRNLKYYNKLSKNWIKEHPDEYKAVQIFNRAVLLEKIKRQPCVKCGNEKSDGHHEDYDYPLDVIWLCHKHHIMFHKSKEWVSL